MSASPGRITEPNGSISGRGFNVSRPQRFGRRVAETDRGGGVAVLVQHEVRARSAISRNSANFTSSRFTRTSFPVPAVDERRRLDGVARGRASRRGRGPCTSPRPPGCARAPPRAPGPSSSRSPTFGRNTMPTAGSIGVALLPPSGAEIAARAAELLGVDRPPRIRRGPRGSARRPARPAAPPPGRPRPEGRRPGPPTIRRNASSASPESSAAAARARPSPIDAPVSRDSAPRRRRSPRRPATAPASPAQELDRLEDVERVADRVAERLRHVGDRRARRPTPVRRELRAGLRERRRRPPASS